MRSQSAWTVREMTQAGEQPKRQIHITGAPQKLKEVGATEVLQGMSAQQRLAAPPAS